MVSNRTQPRLTRIPIHQQTLGIDVTLTPEVDLQHIQVRLSRTGSAISAIKVAEGERSRRLSRSPMRYSLHRRDHHPLKRLCISTNVYIRSLKFYSLHAFMEEFGRFRIVKERIYCASARVGKKTHGMYIVQ